MLSTIDSEMRAMGGRWFLFHLLTTRVRVQLIIIFLIIQQIMKSLAKNTFQTQKIQRNEG